MTTIAWDGRYLAADTLGTRDGNRSLSELRKLLVSNGRAFATCGNYGPAMERLVEWYEAGHDPENLPNMPKADGGLIVVSGRQLWVISCEMPYPDEEHPPFTLGSGRDIALGSMDRGATAMEAVQSAIRWDINTGGEIDFIDMEWIEKGVQRWDGLMPSEKCPMPLNTDDPTAVAA